MWQCNWQKIIYRYISLLLLAMIVACSPSYDAMKTERETRAAELKDDIYVGVVWPEGYEDDRLIEGAQLAADEINQAGGLLGKKLKLVVKINDSDSIKATLFGAVRKLAHDPKIIAVLGHGMSSDSIPASVTYDAYGVLYLAPAATSTRLTQHDFGLVFQTTPSDAVIARKLAEFMYNKGHRKVIALYARGAYGENFTAIFVEHGLKIGLDILTERSFFLERRDFREILAQLRGYEFDSFLLAAFVSQAGPLIMQTRKMGMNQPFYGGDGLDSMDLWKLAGKAANETVVSTVYQRQQMNPKTCQFEKDFFKAYGVYPDTWPAQGYDGIKLLAHAITQAQSISPVTLASTLHYMDTWQGITGQHEFNAQGEVMGKKVYFKKLHDGKFEHMGKKVDCKTVAKLKGKAS